MWVIAQGQDHSAIEEFGERFPHLRAELGKRLAMTRSLKGAVEGARPASIPRFTPTAPTPAMWTRPAVLVPAAALLAALAFGSYMFASNMRPQALTTTKVVPLGGSVQAQGAPPVVKGIIPKDAPKQGGPGPQTPQIAQLPSYMQPRSLAIREGRFMDVISMIGQATGLQIEMPDVPPEMAALQISADYQNMSGLQMLQDLGAKHGFTAFQQGANRVLLIPARPSSELDANASGG